MKKYSHYLNNWVNLIILCTVAFTSLVSAIIGKAMHLDGVRWLGHITYNKTFIADTPHYRYSSCIFQLPSVLITKLFPENIDLIRETFFFLLFIDAVHVYACYIFLFKKVK